MQVAAVDDVLCLDTGHIVYGGGDPMEIARKYPERIEYVHIKAMDPDIVKKAHDEDWPFVKAVHAGCSVAPPAGEPDMHDLIEALADLDAWGVTGAAGESAPALTCASGLSVRSYMNGR